MAKDPWGSLSPAPSAGVLVGSWASCLTIVFVFLLTYKTGISHGRRLESTDRSQVFRDGVLLWITLRHSQV